MEKTIKALFTDLGGTFRIIEPNTAYQYEAKTKIANLVGTDMEPAAFCEMLDRRYDKYREWCLSQMREAPEDELWTKWLVYDYDLERVKKNAGNLTYEYRQVKGVRKVVPHGVETIDTLFKRGYKLGIISDLIGTREIDEWLDADNLRHYFSAVQLSSVCLLRKPAPGIYLRALEEAGVAASEAAFVGDNLNRDIIGAKGVGFGLTIAVEYPGTKLKLTPENKPDIVIHAFEDLLKVLPEAPKADLSAAEQPRI